MNRRIKLLFVIENSCYGGGEKTFSLLIRNLPKEKFAVYCASRPEGRFYEEVKGSCRFLSLDLSSRFNLPNIPRLTRMMRENGIDIAHSQGARADFYCAMAASRAGVKTTATVPMPVEGFDICSLKKKIYLWLDTLAAARRSCAVTVSPFLKEQLRGRYSRVELIPNPVDLSEFDPCSFDAGPVIERFSLRGKIVLGALGRLEWQKGYPVLLKALALVTGTMPELKEKLVCLIAGTGRLEAGLKAQAAACGVSGNVVFCGDVPGVKDFLSALDIFVMPSLQEGQPLALLEAMAMGKAIVAADIPGISETAEKDREALLVPPADAPALAGALRRLLLDPGAAAALGRGARNKAQSFSLPRFIGRHESFYTGLAG